MHPRFSSLELVRLYEESGVNAIEFGFPSTNPWLDGLLIKNLHEFMRSSGLDYEGSMRIFSEIRSSIGIPTVLMTYSDVVLRVGERKFLSDCKTLGFSGAIIPDMDLGQMEGLTRVKFVDIYKDPLEDLQTDFDIFYLRTGQGRTGQRALVDEDRLKDMVRFLKKKTSSYIIGGFGIETEQDVRKMMSFGFDGLAISTSIIKAIGDQSLDIAREKITRFSSAITRCCESKSNSEC